MRVQKASRPARARFTWAFAGGIVLLAIVMSTSTTQANSRTALPTKAAGQLSARLTALSQLTRPTQAVAFHAHGLSLPEQGPGSLIENAAGELLVYIRLATIDQQVLTTLGQAGVQVIHRSPQYGMLTAYVAPRNLQALAAVPGVTYVQEALEPTVNSSAPQPHNRPVAAATDAACPSGTFVSTGDTQLRAAEARTRYGVDGSGVTVGVLSDSFNVERITEIDAEDDIASGDLPGPGNPCGRANPVRVLAESRTGAGRDEGRAMLQIIHDLAPGADLVFATASDGFFAFADNIRRLRAEARADVIVDDYFYPEEPFFQDGPINVAIGDVAQDGAIYVTAGGNIHLTDTAGRPIGSYEAPAYRPMACPTLTDPGTGNPVIPGNDCHDYDPGDGTDAGIEITLPVSGSVIINFQWSEPWFGVQTDLDIYLVDEQNTILAQSTSGLGFAPFEFLSYRNMTDAAQTVQLVTARFSGPTPRFKFTLGSAALNTIPPSNLEYADVGSADIFGPTVLDHSAATAAINVGAVLADDPTNPASFSSHGPARIYWAPVDSIRPAQPLPDTEVRAKPDVMATSGVRTTFFGRPTLESSRCNPADPASPCYFFGTSAAAPHVAAVAALMKQRANLYGVPLDQSRAELLLEQTAASMAGTAESRGAGLVNALGAVGAIFEASPRPLFTGRTAPRTGGQP